MVKGALTEAKSLCLILRRAAEELVDSASGFFIGFQTSDSRPYDLVGGFRESCLKWFECSARPKQALGSHYCLDSSVHLLRFLVYRRGLMRFGHSAPL